VAVEGGEVSGTDAFPEQLTWISVTRREHVHHADGVHRFEHPGVRGVARRGHHEVDRFDGCRVRVDLVAVVDLAVADQHWCPGIYGHLSNLARRRCGPLVAR